MGQAAYRQILPYLPSGLREAISAISEDELAHLEELRLKPGQPILLRFHDGEAFLAVAGGLSPYATLARLLSPEEMRKIVLLLADSSLYALEEELRRGYITLPGGHRVGLTGRAVLENGSIRTIKEISSLNMRIARAVTGVAAPLLPRLLDAESMPCSTLLISPPRAGKTTLLRDLARMLAEGEGVQPLRVGIADERSELAAMRQAQAQLPVGLRSDIIDGCPKAEGLMLLLRAMSPQVLVCDEIGRPEDAAALAEAAHAGVRVLASAHGRDAGEIRARPVLAQLLSEGAFSRLVVLSRRLGPGTVEEVIAC